MNIYVGNLSWTMTDQDLADLFSPYGDVTSAKIVVDKFKGNRSKGFGFVEMADDEQARQAIAQLNDSDQGGRKIIVTKASPALPATVSLMVAAVVTVAAMVAAATVVDTVVVAAAKAAVVAMVAVATVVAMAAAVAVAVVMAAAVAVDTKLSVTYSVKIKAAAPVKRAAAFYFTSIVVIFLSR